MAYVLNGTNNQIQFAIGTALNGVTAGNLSIAVLGVLGDRNNGALVHFLPAGRGSSYTFMETFNSLNYGTGAIARQLTVGNVAVSGNYAIFGGSKASGGTSIPRGHQGDRGSALTHYSGATTLVDGTAVTTSDMMQVGQFQNSATEFANITIACIGIWRRVLSDAEWDSLSVQAVGGAPATYADWQALSPDTLLRFDNIATLTDQTGGGTNETSRSGTTIVLGADPVGFFSSGNTPKSDTETGTLAESEKLALSNTDAAVLAEAQSVRLAATETGSLTESESIRINDADSLTLADATWTVAGHVSDSESLLTSEANGVRLSDSDAQTLSEANALRLADTDALTASEGNQPRLSDAETFTVGDSLYSIRLYSTDTGSLGESESQSAGGTTPSSSDAFTLSESERIKLSDTDGVSLSEASNSIRLADADLMTLTDTLVRAGLSDADAFALADLVATIAGHITSSDTVVLIENQSSPGGSAPEYPSSPIIISIGTPAITIKLGSPSITIGLE